MFLASLASSAWRQRSSWRLERVKAGVVRKKKNSITRSYRLGSRHEEFLLNDLLWTLMKYVELQSLRYSPTTS